jgi:hypothetical protein
MKTFTPAFDRNNEPTITATAVVTHQQGSWKWQIRLATAEYIAVYSPRVKAWLWKSLGVGPSFSGGNTRSGLRVHVDGSKHNVRLNGIELAALAVVRGEN